MAKIKNIFLTTRFVWNWNGRQQEVVSYPFWDVFKGKPGEIPGKNITEEIPV